MNTNQEIFLLVAEELSISNAAKRAFVSQQCVSDHIKRLEDHYGVKLFSRKPFCLNEAGITLQQALLKMKSIEDNLNTNLHQTANGTRGKITLGIGASRSQIIMPLMLPSFYSLFPNVEISLLNDDTIVLEEHLLKNHIDLALGVNPTYKPEYDYEFVCEDPLCLCISEGLLDKAFSPEEKKAILGGHVNLLIFKDVPFIKSYSTGMVNQIFESYMNSLHIQVSYPCHTSHTPTQLALCAKGLGAVINPNMLTKQVISKNALCKREEYIHSIPLPFLSPLRIELLSPSDSEKPLYKKKFQQLLSSTIKEIMNE